MNSDVYIMYIVDKNLIFTFLYQIHHNIKMETNLLEKRCLTINHQVP